MLAKCSQTHSFTAMFLNSFFGQKACVSMTDDEKNCSQFVNDMLELFKLPEDVPLVCSCFKSVSVFGCQTGILLNI